jgi:hypothetical protein
MNIANEDYRGWVEVMEERELRRAALYGAATRCADAESSKDLHTISNWVSPNLRVRDPSLLRTVNTGLDALFQTCPA